MTRHTIFFALFMAVLLGCPLALTAQADIHPDIVFLDAAGQSVAQSGQALSLTRTCRQCHDTDYIAGHSYHASVGADAWHVAGKETSGHPWDNSPGMFGRWSPLTYRRLTPAGEAEIDLQRADWVRLFGYRHVGGGPACFDGKSSAMVAGDGSPDNAVAAEMNCFICHLQNPANAARSTELANGNFAWAVTATLANTSLVRHQGDSWQWNGSEFGEHGAVANRKLRLGKPRAQNCGICHGVAHRGSSPVEASYGLTAWSTETKGQIFSAQKMSASGINLAGKQGLSRPWDVHAEAMLECTSCHHALNNPVQSENKTTKLAHLAYDPRRLTVGQYLKTPNHHFAKGHTAQGTVAREYDGSVRRCENCHNADAAHAWLPYRQRHLQKLTCEVCHIPQVFAAVRRQTDWTMLTLQGEARVEYRGTNGAVDDPAALVTGYQPLILPRKEKAGGEKLAPFNLITSWYWVAGNPARPVALARLKQAFLEGNNYHPELLSALDADKDGKLSDGELRLDTAAKVEAARRRLQQTGVSEPRIAGEIQPISLHHNVAPGDWSTRRCEECHRLNSRLVVAMELSSYVPHGARPELVGDAPLALHGQFVSENGVLVYRPDLGADKLYVIGHSCMCPPERIGALLLLATLLGVLGHASLRIYTHYKHKRKQA